MTARRGFAVATLVLAVVLAIQGPAVSELPDGWVTPVMALEFARTFEEVAWLSDPQVSSALRSVHVTDMAFPLAYGGLLALWARSSRVGSGFALLAIPADWYENRLIFGLIEAIEGGAPPEPWLVALPVGTSAKWALIAAAAVSIAVLESRWWIRGPGVLAAIAVAAGITTFHPVVCEAMGLAVVGFFGALIVGSWRGEDSDGADRDARGVAGGSAGAAGGRKGAEAGE